ncbi:MAG: Tol-Pal system beta propeller repeat protein TolB, partial [Actinobacteria bacterium]|nr:Tol-Pal system beta propeller repeat protein TolB [Actinomycetota bacterium]
MGKRMLGTDHGPAERRRRPLALTFGAAAMVASTLIGEAPAGATHPGLNGKIACASFRGTNGNSEIFSFNPNGTELEATNLTNNPASDSRPKYSPDGREIAFESNRSGSSEIWIMNADGTNVRRLTFTGGNSGATWHPDGSQIM